MKFILVVLTIFVVTIIACSKDKYLTKPTIKIKSLNTEFVPLNGSLIITLDCTDKEGDVNDSVIIIKKRLNKKVVATIRDTIRYRFPQFPLSPKTEIVATLIYSDIYSAITPPFIPGSNPPQRELDTLILRLAVRDKAGHTSDTITSNRIIVYR
jgi:hypothetical protein